MKIISSYFSRSKIKFVREKKAEKGVFFQYYFDVFFEEQISFLTAESMTKQFFDKPLLKTSLQTSIYPRNTLS